MPIFDMVVVGAGGGPDETNLSACVRILPVLDGLMLTCTHVVFYISSIAAISSNHPNPVGGTDW